MAQGRFWLGEERDVMNVIRWFESRFQFAQTDSEPTALRSIFSRGFGEEVLSSEDSGAIDLAAAKLFANDSEPRNFVLPNEDESEPDGQLLYGPVKSYNYFAKPIADESVSIDQPVGLAIFGLLGAPGVHGMKGFDSAFGADSVPAGSLLDGPPADILGAPPVI